MAAALNHIVYTQYDMSTITAVTNKNTAKLHHAGSLYILTYDARKIKYKIRELCYITMLEHQTMHKSTF
jgi:hypothetical protein